MDAAGVGPSTPHPIPPAPLNRRLSRPAPAASPLSVTFSSACHAPPRRVIDEGKILKRMAERPRAASGIGHVSGTEVDHAKSDVPLLAAQGVGPNLAAAERREF